MSKDEQPHRGQLVPAGDGDPRRHHTQMEQINQLVGVSEANPDLSYMARYMARLLALCSLPRTNPGALSTASHDLPRSGLAVLAAAVCIL